MLVVPSASEADAVISADCPLAMFSAIVFASPSVSVGVETSNSSWSVSVTVKVSSAVEPSVLEALTVTVHVVPSS